MSGNQDNEPLRGPLDPRVMLATAVYTQPGVYAVLLGSGVSTGAGIPTGWGVINDLVRQLAAATDPTASGAASFDEPERWWTEHGPSEPLGYSTLLNALAPTQGARQALLARFFEPTDDELEQGLKVPTKAHRSLAQLVKQGFIRVILTTNFDRLIERALQDAGVTAQVLSNVEAVEGMIPLAHAPATVVKLHGDYTELGMRNTVDELSAYPPVLDQLLDTVFDQYGLLVSGWSASWDTALVAALSRARSRRYPIYWDQRSSNGAAARDLVAQRQAIVVPAASADEMFSDLHERIAALQKLSEPPLTTALAVQRLKRYLPDPVRRIELHDLVMDATARVTDRSRQSPISLHPLDHAVVDNLISDLVTITKPLLAMVGMGSFHDTDNRHTSLWVGVIQRLMAARSTPSGGYIDALERLRHLPALLTMRVMGIASLAAGNDALLISLLTKPTWRDPFGNREPAPAALALHDSYVMDSQVVTVLPRWGKQRWLYPQSHLLREILREPLRSLLQDDADYKRSCDEYEYKIALVQQINQRSGFYRPAGGEFIGDFQWRGEGQPAAEVEFRARAAEAGDDWPWWDVVGGRDGIETALGELREILNRLRMH